MPSDGSSAFTFVAMIVLAPLWLAIFAVALMFSLPVLALLKLARWLGVQR